jgi:iron-regulated transporter 1
MGILATFMVPNLVKELGILKVGPLTYTYTMNHESSHVISETSVFHSTVTQAGAAGLIAQSALLGAAVLVFLTGHISRQSTLFACLGLIVRPPPPPPRVAMDGKAVA